MIGDELARLRREYESIGLTPGEMADEPIPQFEEWFKGVAASGVHEPNTFVLATVDADGIPSARAVLMKGLTTDGLVFYTGLTSRKSDAMRGNPVAAATFVWTELHRQVRFEGKVAQVPDHEADEYFATRPRGAQIAAHASRQSEIVPGRDVLDARYANLAGELGEEIPRPEHWGGWRLTPSMVEFWQGRPNRFHDRIRYRRMGEGWVKERLAP